jgi:hypothetical protein
MAGGPALQRRVDFGAGFGAMRSRCACDLRENLSAAHTRGAALGRGGPKASNPWTQSASSTAWPSDPVPTLRRNCLPCSTG